MHEPAPAGVLYVKAFANTRARASLVRMIRARALARARCRRHQSGLCSGCSNENENPLIHIPMHIMLPVRPELAPTAPVAVYVSVVLACNSVLEHNVRTLCL